MLALAPVLALGLASTSAVADTRPSNPSDPRTPPTVSADALPTTQINGVGWYQLVVGNTVYVVGRFTRARPAGAAAGTSEVVRNNILAYDITTGALKSGFNANLNAQAYGLAMSPDGTRLYVGGEFTTVNGSARSRIAALNPSTGALISSFAPKASSTVRSVAATNSTVYFGGLFTSVNGVARSRLAASRASDGALTGWAPKADNGRVNALLLSPTADRVVVGGSFTTLNGSSNPGYGLGAVSTASGANVRMAVNGVVRNAGADSSILSLSSDGTNFYGTGYIFGTGGNLEGAFAARWSDTAIVWVEDCHGDSYGVHASSTAVYVAGHPHYCKNLGGYGESPAQRAVAFSRAATGKLTKDTVGYPSFTGQPAPSLQNWFPQLDTGTVSGQSQAAWAVAGSGKYVAMAGEFPRANGTAQQGLVRFATADVAPNKRGPRASGTAFTPKLSSPSTGTVRVDWPANFDHDNSNLTYSIYRDASTTPIRTLTAASTWWSRPTLTHTDVGVARGTHSYFVTVRDPFGNTLSSPKVSITL